jgi:hypothetical protein
MALDRSRAGDGSPAGSVARRRPPARAADHPARSEAHFPAAPSGPGAGRDGRDGLLTSEPPVAATAPGRAGGAPPPGVLLGWALALAGLALGVLLCALALAALVGVASLAGGPWQPMSDRLGAAVSRAGAVALGAGQTAADLLDPRHPPREALPLDAEFDVLTVVSVGAPVGATGVSRVELASIVKRADAASDATAQYAVVRRTLVEPQARRVVGVPVGTDRGEHEHYLYRGQSFRLGPHYYKVNWVSLDRQQVAIARYRSADGAIGRLVFEYD